MNGVETNEANSGKTCPASVQRLPLTTLVVIPRVEGISVSAGELIEAMFSDKFLTFKTYKILLKEYVL